MDKENLYYIIQKGTNQRERPVNELWIGENDVSEERAKKLSFAFKIDYVAISIRDYEEKFTDTVHEVKKEPAAYNLYSTGKHLLGLYNNKVIVLFAEGPMWGYVYKIISDPEVVKNICEYMKYTGQFKKHAEELIEELIAGAMNNYDNRRT